MNEYQSPVITDAAPQADAERQARRHVAHWLRAHCLGASDVDCVNAVMLKILDGKCKMRSDEKRVMRALYRQVRGKPGMRLGPGVHVLVSDAGTMPDDAMRERIYEQRVLAETRIARPVMKRFKAMLRCTGLLDVQSS